MEAMWGQAKTNLKAMNDVIDLWLPAHFDKFFWRQPPNSCETSLHELSFISKLCSSVQNFYLIFLLSIHIFVPSSNAQVKKFCHLPFISDGFGTVDNIFDSRPRGMGSILTGTSFSFVKTYYCHLL